MSVSVSYATPWVTGSCLTDYQYSEHDIEGGGGGVEFEFEFLPSCLT